MFMFSHVFPCVLLFEHRLLHLFSISPIFIGSSTSFLLSCWLSVVLCPFLLSCCVVFLFSLAVSSIALSCLLFSESNLFLSVSHASLCAWYAYSCGAEGGWGGGFRGGGGDGGGEGILKFSFGFSGRSRWGGFEKLESLAECKGSYPMSSSLAYGRGELTSLNLRASFGPVV